MNNPFLILSIPFYPPQTPKDWFFKEMYVMQIVD